MNFQKLIDLVNTLVSVYGKLQKLAENEKAQRFLVGLDQTIDAIENAKSLREKIDAAKKLGDLLRSIH